MNDCVKRFLKSAGTFLWVLTSVVLASLVCVDVECAVVSARQHPSYGDCLEVKREYYQNSFVLRCVTQCFHSPQHTYVSSSYRSNRLGLSHWDPYTVRRGGCLELYYCNMVDWFWLDSSVISTTGWCFDTVDLVIWPVKIVPEMTYYVSSGTLNPTH